MSLESIKDTIHDGFFNMSFAMREVTEAGVLLNHDDFGVMERDKERALDRAHQAEEKLAELRDLTGKVSTLLGWGVDNGRTAERKAVEASGLVESARGRAQGTQDSLAQAIGTENAKSYTTTSLETTQAANKTVNARNELAVRYTDEFAAVQSQSQELNARLAAIGGELAGLIEKINSIGNNPDGSNQHSEHQATTDTLHDAKLATRESNKGLSELYYSYETFM